jgi:hypothetical protein
LNVHGTQRSQRKTAVRLCRISTQGPFIHLWIRQISQHRGLNRPASIVCCLAAAPSWSNTAMRFKISDSTARDSSSQRKTSCATVKARPVCCCSGTTDARPSNRDRPCVLPGHRPARSSLVAVFAWIRSNFRPTPGSSQQNDHIVTLTKIAAAYGTKPTTARAKKWSDLP